MKMAEIQILRKKIHSLQEQVSLLNSRTERVFPSPLLSSTSMESTRVRQATAKVLFQIRCMLICKQCCSCVPVSASVCFSVHMCMYMYKVVTVMEVMLV